MTCPDPQTLARFAEGRLSRDEVAAVLRHLDLCADCTSVVEVANQTVAEEEKIEARPRWTKWWLAIAAAAVVVVVGGSLLRDPVERDGTARLVALAPPGERLVEPRLSGGFAYAAYRGARRANDVTTDAARMKLVGAAGEMIESAQSDPSADAQQSAGIAWLLIDQPLQAVAALRAASERSPDDATAWSDLAAAHYTVASRLGRASAYSEALVAADRALRIDPNHTEALFNRALTLHRLGLHEEARAAWQRYLEVDPSSPWATEAREWLGTISGMSMDEEFRRDRPRLEAAAAAADAGRVRELVAKYPQQTRSWGEGEYLSQWALAELRGDRAAADHQLAIARAIGDVLAETKNETLLRDAVRAAAADRGLAAAQVKYYEGRKLYARQEPAMAEPLLREAAKRFGSTPMALVARYFAANATFDQRRVAEARKELIAVLAECDAHPTYPALAAQVRWQLALADMVDGAWPDALPLLREAEAIFTRQGESRNAAAIAGMLGRTLGALGRADEAWAARIRSFELLTADGNRERLQVAVGGTARMEVDAGRLESARAFVAIEEAICRASGRAASLVDVLVNGAMVEMQIGDDAGAARFVAEARLTAARITDPAMRAHAEADVQFAQGALEVRSDPAAARENLSRAIDAFTRGRAVALPHAYLLRARALARLRDVDGAARDLDQGIAVLERHAEPGGAASRMLDAKRALFEDAILLALQRGETAAAFAYSEQMRGHRNASLAHVQRALAGSGAAVLILVALPEEVVAFCLTDQNATVARSPVARARLRELANGSEAGELYDILVRPSLQAMANARTLFVVADDPLRNVMFAALTDRATNRRLIERVAVVMAPRAPDIVAATTNAPSSVLAVALPSGESAGSAALPDGAREVAEIARVYREQTVTDGGNFAAFAAAAARADVVHLAGHTQSGALMFGGGQRVSSQDVASMPELGGLVILAACESLRAPSSLGDAFLARGARAVIGTLTPIPDRDARDLFVAIHRQLAAGMDEASALRHVQLEAMRTGRGGSWESLALLTNRIRH